jgi:hypothetical protein
MTRSCVSRRALIRLAAMAVIVLAVAPASAGADVASVELGRAAGNSHRIDALFEITRSCGRGGEPATQGTPCREWFAEASEYRASEACPGAFDPSHGVWVGPREERGFLLESVTFQPRQQSGAIWVCLYVHDLGDRLVGQARFALGGAEAAPKPVAPPPVALPPANAPAGSGTVDIGRNGTRLEASFEIRRNCGRGSGTAFEGAPCREWFGEASEYRASEACPPSFDASHRIWVGSPEEVGFLLESVTFQPRQQSGAISVCLYVHDVLDSLVGQSRFLLGRAHTSTRVVVSVSRGCKINSSVTVNSGNRIRGRYRERLSWGPGPNEHVDGIVNVGEGTEWRKELPGRYRYSAEFLGNREYSPSRTSVTFRVYPCSGSARTIVSSARSR